MTFARTTLITLAALAIVAAIGVWVVAPPQSDESSPAPSAAQAALLQLTLPTPPTTAPDTAALPPSAPLLAVALPGRNADTASRIGSEGYGPHIERAQAGTDIAAIWEAVQWLQQCATNEQRRNGAERVRSVGVAPEAMTTLMTAADAEARRCQTVTAQHRAMLSDLAARAMHAGMPLAASAYADAASPQELTTEQRQEVADAMRRDAMKVGAMGLLAALQADEAWGLGDADRRSYLAALLQLTDEPGGTNPLGVMLRHTEFRFKAAATLEQQAEALRAGREIAARILAGGRP